MVKKFYVTNAIPYVNAPPHLGHALEFVQTDTIARYRRLLGEDVFYLTGADENALKNVLAAEEAGVPTQQFVDENTARLEGLKEILNLSYDDFIRTSDPQRHWRGAEKLWRECDKAGDIYQKDYEGLYCVGCEEFKTEKDLVDGLCPEHQVKPESVKERNYFFRLSKYQDRLRELIESDELKIIPKSRKNEVLSFIKSGLEDFSISRSKERARGWGIPVPGDESQIVYVWFDALANYITALGYGQNKFKVQSSKFKVYWPADVHVLGKGITRFHAIYWPAMLLSIGLKLPKAIFVHGYITIEGQKIGKSLGNIIDPYKVVGKYGTDAVRYYLLKAIPPTADGDFSISHFEEVYNADLANGLGNLVQRLAKLCERVGFKRRFSPVNFWGKKTWLGVLRKHLDAYRFNDGLAYIWENIKRLDKEIDTKRPWEKDGKELEEILKPLVIDTLELASALKPFMPKTAEEIEKIFTASKIKAGKPLFPRI